MRLASLQQRHPVGNTPESCALLALFHLHAARFAARQQRTGELVLLHRRTGEDVAAKRYREAALELAPTEAVRELLCRRLLTPQ